MVTGWNFHVIFLWIFWDYFANTWSKLQQTFECLHTMYLCDMYWCLLCLHCPYEWNEMIIKSLTFLFCFQIYFKSNLNPFKLNLNPFKWRITLFFIKRILTAHCPLATFENIKYFKSKNKRRSFTGIRWCCLQISWKFSSGC